MATLGEPRKAPTNANEGTAKMDISLFARFLLSLSHHFSNQNLVVIASVNAFTFIKISCSAIPQSIRVCP
jgi:hypothetical protein